MSRDLEQLKKHLKRKRKYSFSILKDTLQIKSDEDLMTLIIELLKGELEDLNFNTKSSRYSFLFCCFEYLNWAESKIDFEDENTYHELSLRLIEVSDIIENKIQNPGQIIMDKEYDLTKKKLKKMLLVIEKFKEKHLNYNIYSNDESVYKVLKTSIFTIKKPRLVSRLLKQMPSSKNIKINNYSLLEEVADEYIRLIKDNPVITENKEDIYDIFHYASVLKTLSRSYYDEETIIKIKNKFNNAIFSVTANPNISREHKNKILNYIKIVNKPFGCKLEINDQTTNIVIPTKIVHYNLETNFTNHINYTDKEIFTIDGGYTNFKEDAFSFKKKDKGYELGIYIVDLASQIKEGSLLDEAINQKATSFEHYETLLPNEEVANRISLEKGVVRPVQSFIFELDEFANIMSIKMEQALIKVKDNFSFSNLKRALNSDKKQYENIRTLEKIFYTKQINRLSETKIKVENLDIKNRNKTSLLVENILNLLNDEVANYFNEKGLPFLYRNNKSSSIKDLISLFDEKDKNTSVYSVVEYLNNNELALELSINNIDKPSGLVSKPARELDALYNQRQIKKFILEKESMNKLIEAKDRLLPLCESLNKAKEFKEIMQDRELEKEFQKTLTKPL
jgi:hypothetical protein